MVTDNLEAKIVRAVRELVNHPRGGKLEVYVNTTHQLGERTVKILPLLAGTQSAQITISTDDD